MLGGINGQHAIDQARRESFLQAVALCIGQPGDRCDVQTELDPGIGRVDTLATRPRGVAEPFGQQVGRDVQAARQPGARGDVEVIHPSSVART